MTPIVLTVFLTIAGGDRTLTIPGYMSGGDEHDFQTLGECSRMAQPIVADWLSRHPGAEVVAFECGPERKPS